MKRHPHTGKWFSQKRKPIDANWQHLGGPFETKRAAIFNAEMNCPKECESICGKMSADGNLQLDPYTYEMRCA